MDILDEPVDQGEMHRSYRFLPVPLNYIVMSKLALKLFKLVDITISSTKSFQKFTTLSVKL